MAHFIGGLKGRGDNPVSRLGTKESGIVALTDGWDIGGEVRLKHQESLGGDVVYFSINNGSNNPESTIICSFTKKNNELVPLYINEDILKSFYLKVLQTATEPEENNN